MAGTALAVTAPIVACEPREAADVRSFELDYQTGSIAPPYNHAYRIVGTRDGAELELVYTLTYLFREGMDAEELEALGYSADDDIDWSTTVSGADADAWLELAAATEVSETPDDPAAGADHISVTIVFAGESQRSGVPTNRDEWERLASELDRQAREALDHPRPEP